MMCTLLTPRPPAAPLAGGDEQLTEHADHRGAPARTRVRGLAHVPRTDPHRVVHTPILGAQTVSRLGR